MYIRRFTYKPEDVECELCTEHKKCDRNLMKCPWIAERIEASVVSYQEAVLTVFPGKGLSFPRLLEAIRSYPGTFWLNKQHQNRMEMFNHRLGYVPKRNTPVYYAAMYLLTSSDELLHRTSNCFFRKGIEFRYAALRDIEMLNSMEVREDDEEFQNPVDLMFTELEKENPQHFAVRQYKKYKLAAGVVCFKRLLNQSIGKSLKTYNLNNHERSASNEKKRENHSSLRAFEP